MHEGTPAIGIIPRLFSGTSTFTKALAAIRELGFVSIELPTNPTAFKGTLDLNGDVAAIREKLNRRGLCVTAIAADNDFVQADRTELDRQISHVNWCVDWAVEFDAIAVRFLGGMPKEGITDRAAVKMIIHATEQVAAYAELHGIKLGLENVGPYTNKLDTQLQIIERVNAPMLGATFNPANYLEFGHAPKKILALYKKLAHHVVHTHLTDGLVSDNNDQRFQSVALGHGQVQLAEAVKILLDTGYSGDFLVDCGGNADNATIRTSYRYLRSQLPQRIYSYI